ncbi:uncharacterized protein LOC141606677 isoform X2 [Silene latifolia]|uniref:uncharacterized protein LOC141606677 isoform X2 n=1 Tax=Silene latifolia TaxID=37657 RepID=UPI003D77E6EB
MGFGENVAKMQKGTIDRISELPEFILHTILSMLDTKEAGRASVLSKKWYDAWSSIPVLDFNPQYFQKYGNRRHNYDDDTVERFVGFIDKTMERYFTRKYRITKFYLMLPKVDEKIETLVDKWIMIAVQNQIQSLEILIRGCRNNYRLPEILFCAKSLKYLKCGGIILPFYGTMELNSLEYLALIPNTLDADMLQKIISSCPLVELDIAYDEVFSPVWIPWMKKVNGEVKSRGTRTMQSNLQESPLQKFVYSSISVELPWPWDMNLVALKNLRKLEFNCVPLTDDIVSELSNGLVVLESLIIVSCSLLKCINISSNSLKQLRITDSLEIEKATIDAPKLLEFLCSCEVVTSLSVIRALDHCNARFWTLKVYSLTTVWLVKLKKFLVETNFFNSLVIDFNSSPVMVEEDLLRNVGGAPYKLRELKLRGTSTETATKSSFLMFLNGLFWCCHPDVLSITTNLQDSAAKVCSVAAYLPGGRVCMTN